MKLSWNLLVLWVTNDKTHEKNDTYVIVGKRGSSLGVSGKDMNSTQLQCVAERDKNVLNIVRTSDDKNRGHDTNVGGLISNAYFFKIIPGYKQDQSGLFHCTFAAFLGVA